MIWPFSKLGPERPKPQIDTDAAAERRRRDRQRSSASSSSDGGTPAGFGGANQAGCDTAPNDCGGGGGGDSGGGDG